MSLLALAIPDKTAPFRITVRNVYEHPAQKILARPTGVTQWVLLKTGGPLPPQDVDSVELPLSPSYRWDIKVIYYDIDPDHGEKVAEADGLDLYWQSTFNLPTPKDAGADRGR